jgi:hypothetical protein
VVVVGDGPDMGVVPGVVVGGGNVKPLPPPAPVSERGLATTELLVPGMYLLTKSIMFC